MESYSLKWTQPLENSDQVMTQASGDGNEGANDILYDGKWTEQIRNIQFAKSSLLYLA